MKTPFWFLAVLSGAALLLAILSLPYGYYSLLRVFICFSGLAIAYKQYHLGNPGWMIMSLMISAIFNPVSPLYLDKESWILIDIFSSGFFFYSSIKLNKDTKA
jgi:hypothetical protein